MPLISKPNVATEVSSPRLSPVELCLKAATAVSAKRLAQSQKEYESVAAALTLLEEIGTGRACGSGYFSQRVRLHRPEVALTHLRKMDDPGEYPFRHLDGSTESSADRNFSLQLWDERAKKYAKKYKEVAKALEAVAKTPDNPFKGWGTNSPPRLFQAQLIMQAEERKLRRATDTAMMNFFVEITSCFSTNPDPANASA